MVVYSISTQSTLASQQFDFNSNLDSSLLKEYYGTSIKDVLTMFEVFLETTSKELIELDITNDAPFLIRRKIHKMKPNFKLVGLPEYYEAFLVIETQWETNDSILTHLNKLKELKYKFQSFYLPIIKQESNRMKQFIR